MKSIFTVLVLLFISISLYSQVKDHSKLIFKVDGKEAAYPRLSVDGKRILYQTNEKGNWQLRIIDLATGRQTNVLEDSYNNNFPDWSADNQWIAFVSDRDGNEEIYLMHTDGSDLKKLTNNAARDIHPYFSPDGKFILFNSTRNNGSLDIYRYTIADGALDRLTDTGDDETCARYSPDMSMIVLLQNSMSKDDVMLMDARTYEMKNLSGTPDIRDGWPMFSYDSKWVYYSSFENMDACIYRIKPDGTEKTKLTSALPGEEDARVNLARDCSWLVYNKRIGETIEIRSLHL